MNEPVYTIESDDGTTLFSVANSLEYVLLAAATMREMFPDEPDFVIRKGGEYDPSATLLAQKGMAT